MFESDTKHLMLAVAEQLFRHHEISIVTNRNQEIAIVAGRTVIAVNLQCVDARRLGQADDDLLGEHPGGHPERGSVAREKKNNALRKRFAYITTLTRGDIFFRG